MSRLYFFIQPEIFFSIIQEISRTCDVSVIFYRSKLNNLASGFAIMDRGDNLCEIYTEDKYTKIYMSMGGLPIHSQDWEFLNRSANELIVVEGGRLSENSLEMFKSRIFSKTTHTQKIFNKLKKLLVSACPEKGLYVENGKFFYDKILYDTEILNYILYDNLNKNDEPIIYVMEKARLERRVDIANGQPHTQR